MKQKHFFVVTGNNGASYIVNCKSWASVKRSLQFYKATSFKSKVLKNGLHVMLFGYGKLPFKTLKSSSQITEYLKKLGEQEMPFNIDDSCSVLISPTRDKIIVHHHEQYFEKFAFGRSYQKVKNEASIYELLKRPLEDFQISKYYDAYDEAGRYCSFKLSNTHLKKQKQSKEPLNLLPLLLEFFNVVPKSLIQVDAYVDALIKRVLKIENYQMDSQVTYLNKIKQEYGALEFPLGLVHRDFKHWNMLALPKVLLFDFEEAITKGLPMEDLLNFYVDPIINYTDSEAVYTLLNQQPMQAAFNAYLKALGVSMKPEVFINLYLIERLLFWSKANELETASRYFKLSNLILSRTNNL